MYAYIDFIFKHVFTNNLLIGLVIYLIVLLLVALSLVLFTLRLHRNNEVKAHMWRKLEERWEPLLMEILAQEQWPNSFYELVQEGEELFFIDFLMRYAEKLSGKSRQTVAELAQPYLAGLAERTKTGDAEQRARAVLTLSTLAPQVYERQIVAALDDESPLVCMLATRALADNHATQYTAQILDKITRFKAWSQNYLISTLVALSRQEPEVLRNHLTDQRPDWVRLIILKALTELNDWQAMPLAVEFLNTDQDRELQAAALQFITRLGHDGLLDLIRKKCRSEDFVIRLHAVKALAHLGNQEDRELLEELVSDPSQWIAYQAAFALKETGNFDSLMRLAHADDSPRATLAAQVLYDYHDPASLDYLCQQESFAAQVPHWINMLELHKSTAKWKSMVELFLSETIHPRVAMTMAQCLSGHHPDSIYAKILTEVVSKRNPPLHQLVALHHLNAKMALETLKEKFQQSSDWDLRSEILDLLNQYPQSQTHDFFSKVKNLLTSGQFQDIIPALAFDQIQINLEHKFQKNLSPFRLDPQVSLILSYNSNNS